MAAGKKYFGKAWRPFDLARQREVVRRLLEEEDETALVAWLMEAFDLGNEAADGGGRCARYRLAPPPSARRP